MKPKLTTAAVIAALVLCAFLFSRSCGLTDKYKLARHDYKELLLITEADKKMSDEKIQHMTDAIGQADETIVQLQGVIREKVVQVSGLSRELAELRAAEPSQPELESQPLVISLRKQVSKLTEMYSLSQQIVTTQAEEIDVLGGKCNALVTIGTEWRQQYEREHALRLSAEKLVTSLEKRVKSQGLLGKAKTVAIVTIAGGLAYSILKKN